MIDRASLSHPLSSAGHAPHGVSDALRTSTLYESRGTSPREHGGFVVRAPEFADLSPEARRQLARFASRRTYQDGQVIYYEDDEADKLHFVVSGHVRISFLMDDGDAVLCSILPPGECFGELSVFEPCRHCEMAAAIGETVLTAIPTRAVRALAEDYPEIANGLARIVARRYRSYVELTRGLSLRSLSARLSRALLRLSATLGTKTTFVGREVDVIAGVITQADLGLMARGARGNVNRALKGWERLGWIAIRNRQILLLDRARLEELASAERPSHMPVGRFR